MSITSFQGQHPLVRRPPGKHHSFHLNRTPLLCAWIFGAKSRDKVSETNRSEILPPMQDWF